MVAAMQGDNQQFGVQYIAQGHFDMQTKWNKPATFL